MKAKPEKRGYFYRVFRDDELGLHLTKPQMRRFLLGHILLGPALHFIPFLSTAYAVMVGLFCLYIAVKFPRPDAVIGAMGYVAGMEVLVRMSRAQVFWMYSEYLIIFLALTMMLRQKPVRKPLLSALFYMFFLVPSVFVLILTEQGETARQAFAFNLLGPLALGFAVFAVSRVHLERSIFEDSLFISSLPVFAIMSIISIGYIQGKVEFMAVSASNKLAAGGFAPNQVANALSYGTVCFITLYLLAKKWAAYRYFYLGSFIVASLLAILTLSRGGIMNLGGFLLVIALFRLVGARHRIRFAILLSLMTYMYINVLLPAIDDYSKGAVERRYEDKKTSQRDVLAAQEYQVFLESPVLGVGPGGAVKYHQLHMREESVMTHTEYTRLLAEHGSFGILAFVSLLLMYFKLQWSAKSIADRGWVLGALAWVLIMFSHSATRIVLFAFLSVLMVILVYGIEKPEQEKSWKALNE